MVGNNMDECLQIEKDRDDLLSILNELRIGTIMTDKDGRVIFLSKAAQKLTGNIKGNAATMHWEKMFSLKEEDNQLIKKMFSLPKEKRAKMSVQLASQKGQHYWVDLEIHDDPRDPVKKIFFLYDMSEVYDLRLLLDEKAQFHNLIGKSKSMMDIYQKIKDVSGVQWTVLIEGETGTGKELVARAIHFSSHRKEQPFIAVNCAGLTDSLLSSQLFGHKKGAFTGAIQDSKGVFEAAHGGTILLDEVGDISMNVQTNLLRVLEDHEITRVGESTSRKIDVRVLASTNLDLNEQVLKGSFRQDLLYRIRVARIKLPPLREHREDIPLLAEAFLSQSRAVTGKSIEGISTEAMRLMLEYFWPGNVREIKSAIEYAVIHCKGSLIKVDDLPPEIITSTSSSLNIHMDEKEQLLDALKKTGGNNTAAANMLGMSRATFYRHLSKLGIRGVKQGLPE